MDYLITAAALAPPGEEAFVRERIVRLPHTHMCYEPLYAPTVGPLPAKTNGYVTFGCFNNPAKFSEDVLVAFAAVMRGVPASRLKLRYRSLADQSTRARLLRVLEANGIAPARIEMAGELPREAYLASYNEIDLALDSFPFSGGMTTCDALWMGCPVVTFPGQTFAGRTTAMILSAVGLPELAGQDRAAYETLAIQLASDPENSRRFGPDCARA